MTIFWLLWLFMIVYDYCTYGQQISKLKTELFFSILFHQGHWKILRPSGLKISGLKIWRRRWLSWSAPYTLSGKVANYVLMIQFQDIWYMDIRHASTTRNIWKVPRYIPWYHISIDLWWSLDVVQIVRPTLWPSLRERACQLVCLYLQRPFLVYHSCEVYRTIRIPRARW